MYSIIFFLLDIQVISNFVLFATISNVWVDGHESEWTPGVGDGRGGLACCDSWSCKESDTTEWLIWSDLIWAHHSPQNLKLGIIPKYAMEFHLFMIPLEYFSTTIFLPLQILLIFQVPSFLSWHYTIKVHLSFIMYSHIVVIVYLLSHYRRRQWHPTPVLLPGRSLVGCSPWGR